MPSKRSAQVKIYELEVTLRDSKPPIWRRIQVRGDTTLPVLHYILQKVMGWENCHLHEFAVGAVRYGVSDPDWEELGILDGGEIKLDRIAKRKGRKLLYRYDFGDDWEHEIRVEKILEPAEGVQYPICLAGKRNCPP